MWNSSLAASVAPQQRLDVLSVEDGPIFSERVRRLLEAEGFAPAIARVQSLAELERALDRQTWNLVLGDHTMPGFNPEQALELIKSRGLDLPFIVVAGYTGAADAALRARAHDYIIKTSLNRLGVAVRKALEGAAERAVLRERERARGRLRVAALAVGAGDLLAAAERAAHYDAMTGLPNRLLLTERLTSLIAESARAEKSFALVYADLDDFRAVNDAFGHEAGNAVLRELGRRLGQVS